MAAVVGLVGLFALVLFLGQGPPPETVSETETAPEPSPVEAWQAASVEEIPVSERDFVRGPDDAEVTIIEFSDFECPFCRRADTEIREVLAKYPSEVRLVYKNFPLDMACNTDMAQQLHPFACKAAVMARCAGREDPELFWQFHDAVFAMDDFSEEALALVTSELGLGDEFQSCVTGRETFDEVRVDIELARNLGVEATPTLFVNGRVAPSYEVEALSEIIDHILTTD